MPIPLQQTSIDPTKASWDKFQNSQGSERQNALQQQYDILKGRGLSGDIAKNVLRNPDKPFTPYTVNERFTPQSWKQIRGMIPYNKVVSEYYKRSDRAGRKGGGVTPYGTSFWKGGIAGQESLEGEVPGKTSMWSDQDNYFEKVLTSDDPLYSKEKEILQEVIHENRPVFMNREHFAQITPMSEDEWITHKMMNDWKELTGPEKFGKAVMLVGGTSEGILNIFGNAFKEIGKIQQSDMPLAAKAMLVGQATYQGLEQGNLRNLPNLSQGISNWVRNRFRTEGEQYKANYERYLDEFAWQQDRMERMSAAVLPGITELAEFGTVDNFVPWFSVPARVGKPIARKTIQAGAVATTGAAKIISGASKAVAATAALPRKGSRVVLKNIFGMSDEAANQALATGFGLSAGGGAASMMAGIPDLQKLILGGPALAGMIEGGARMTGRMADNLATASWVLTQPATQRRLLWRMADTIDAAKFPKLQKMALTAAQMKGDRALQAMFETVYGAASSAAVAAALEGMASNGDWDRIFQAIGGGATFGVLMGGAQGLRGSDNGVTPQARTQGSIDAYQQQNAPQLPRGSRTPEKLTAQESYGRLWDKTGEDPFTPEMSRSERMSHLNTESQLHQKHLFDSLSTKTKEFLSTNWEVTGENSNIFFFDNGTTYRSFVANYFGKKIPANQALPAGWRDPGSGQIYVDMSRPQLAEAAIHRTVVHETVHGEIGKWLHEGDASAQTSKVMDVLGGYIDPNGVPFQLPNGQEIRLNADAVRFRDGYDGMLGDLQDLGIKDSALHLADEMLSMESQKIFAEDSNVWKTMEYKRPGLLGVLSSATQSAMEKLGIKESGSAHQQKMIRNYKAMQAANYRAESVTADEGIRFNQEDAASKVPGLTGAALIPIEGSMLVRQIESGRGPSVGGSNVIHNYFEETTKRVSSKIELKPGIRAHWKIRNKNQFATPELIESIDLEKGLVKFKDHDDLVPINQVKPAAGYSGQVVGKGTGNEGTRLPDDFKEGLRQHPHGAVLASQFEQIETAMGDGNLMTIAYSNRVRSRGNNPVEVRDMVPLQWYVSKAGNINVQGWDMNAIRYNLKRMQEGGYISNPDEFNTQMLERMHEIEERVRGKDLTQVLDLLGEFRIGKGEGDNLAMLIYAALGTPPAVLQGKNPELAAFMERTQMKHVNLSGKGSTFKSFRAADLYSAGVRFDNQGRPMRGPNFRYHNIKAAATMRPYDPREGMPRPQLSPGEQAPKVEYPPEMINGLQEKAPFLKRNRPVNNVEITRPNGEKIHSMVQPMRTGLIESEEAGYFNFKSEKEFDGFLGNLMGRMFKWAQEKPDQATASLKFYPGFAKSAVDLSRDASGKWDLDVADMNIRSLSYTSVRADVRSNSSKAAQTIASPFSKLPAGYKAGSMTQVKGLGRIFEDWQNGKPFDMSIPGVANKVRNFYLNGSAELLLLAIKEGFSEPKIIEYAEKLNKSLQDISIGREIRTMADVKELQLRMDRQNTTDMWDMAAKGAAWPGFVFTDKKPNYYWTNPDKGEVFLLNSPEAQEVLRWHQKNGEDVKMNKKGEHLGKVITSFDDLTTQEKRSLKYDEEAGTITLFREKDDAGLSAGGESAVYERAQAISGMIADRINQMGGFHGKEIWTARDVQQYLWGMEKSQNPIKGNRDFSSYDEVVDQMYQLLETSKDWNLETSELGSMGRKGLGFLKAMQRSYAALGSQVVPTKALTVEPGPWMDFQNKQLERLRQEGDPDPETTFTHAVADALVPALQGLQDMQFKSKGEASFKFGTTTVTVPEGGVSLLAGKHVYSNTNKGPKRVPIYLDRNGSTRYYEFPPGDTRIEHNNFEGLNFTLDGVQVKMDAYTPEGSDKPLVTPSMVFVGHGDAADARLAAKTINQSTGQQTGVLIREKDPSEHYGSVKGQPIPEKGVVEFDTGDMAPEQVQQLALQMNQIKDENGNPLFPGFLPTDGGIMFTDISYKGGDWATAVRGVDAKVFELAQQYGVNYKVTSKIIETYGPSTNKRNERASQAGGSPNPGTDSTGPDAQPSNPGATQSAGVHGGGNGPGQQPTGAGAGSIPGGTSTGSASQSGGNPGTAESGTFRVSGARSIGKFLAGIQHTKQHHKFGPAVDVKEPAFYSNPENKVFMTSDGNAGVVVNVDGDLVSVFNKGGGDIRAVLREAAPHAVTLDAYDINHVLPDLYDNYGFIPIARTKWDDEYAKPEWKYDTMGRPDVVLMVRDPSQYLRKPSVPYEKIMEEVPLFEGPDAWDKAAALQEAAKIELQDVEHSYQHVNEHRYMQLAREPKKENIRKMQAMVDDARVLSGDQGGSTAPIEYDANGNVVPLSQRFDLPGPVNHRDISDPLGELVQSRLQQTVSKAPVGYRGSAEFPKLKDHIEGIKKLGNVDQLSSKIAEAKGEATQAKSAHNAANKAMTKTLEDISKKKTDIKEAKGAKKEKLKGQLKVLEQKLADQKDILKSKRSEFISSMNRKAKAGKVPSQDDIDAFSSQIQADMVAGRITENEGGHLWKMSQYFTVTENNVNLYKNFNNGTLKRKTQDWITELAAKEGKGRVTGIKVQNPPPGLVAPRGWKKGQLATGEFFLYRTEVTRGKKAKTPGQIAKGWGKTIRIPKIDGQDEFMMVVKRGGTTSAIEIHNPTEAEYYMNNLPDVKED